MLFDICRAFHRKNETVRSFESFESFETTVLKGGVDTAIPGLASPLRSPLLTVQANTAVSRCQCGSNQHKGPMKTSMKSR